MLLSIYAPSLRLNMLNMLSSTGLPLEQHPMHALLLHCSLQVVDMARAQCQAEDLQLKESELSSKLVAQHARRNSRSSPHLKQQGMLYIGVQVVAMAGAQFQAEELQLKESELSSKLEAKRAEEARMDFNKQLGEQREALQKLATAMSNLRAERDRVIMVGVAAAFTRDHMVCFLLSAS